MSYINCAQNFQECPFYARLTVEHESAALRLKKNIKPEFPLDAKYSLQSTIKIHALFALAYTSAGGPGLTIGKDMAFTISNHLLTHKFKDFKWRQIDYQKLSEISLGKMYTRSLMISGLDTALKIASIFALNTFLGIGCLHFYTHTALQMILTGIQMGKNTAQFIETKRTLAKFDEMNHLYYHLAAERTERVQKAGSLDEHRLKSLNEALKVAALRKLMNEPPQTLVDETNQDHADDLVDAKANAKITSFLAVIHPVLNP